MGKMYIGTADGMKELKTGKEEVYGEQIFTSSGTFTVPEGVTHIDVFLVGGGASGGVYKQNDLVYSCGGAGGYTRTITSLPVTPGSEHEVIIGSGGPSGDMITRDTSNGTYYGSAGGNTSFDGYICKGGYPSSYNTSGFVCNGGGTIAKYVSMTISGYTYTVNSEFTISSSGYQQDSTHAFGLKTETEYCTSGKAGCGGKAYIYASNDNIPYNFYNAPRYGGNSGICIIRW